MSQSSSTSYRFHQLRWQDGQSCASPNCSCHSRNHAKASKQVQGEKCKSEGASRVATTCPAYASGAEDRRQAAAYLDNIAADPCDISGLPIEPYFALKYFGLADLALKLPIFSLHTTCLATPRFWPIWNAPASVEHIRAYLVQADSTRPLL